MVVGMKTKTFAKTLRLEFSNQEDFDWAQKLIAKARENMAKDSCTPLAGGNASILLCALGRSTPPNAGTPPEITQLEMTEADIERAEKVARRLGYTQTAYTSTSSLWGCFCLPDRAGQKSGCIIKTREFGLMFVADLEDMHCQDILPVSHTQKSKAVAA